MIVLVLSHYFPSWVPPVNTRAQGWTKTKCPVHAEDRASAAISVQFDAVKCQACGYSGNVHSIIMEEEGVSFAQAKRIAIQIATGGGSEVQPGPTRKPSTRVFGEQRPGSGSDRPVPPWVRE